MLKLYAHPFSSYCQKVLIALYENDISFEFRLVEPGSSASDELAALWPFSKFPVLVDGKHTVIEATCIVEHLHVYHRGPVPLIPADPARALKVRFLDRFFDNYVSTPQGKFVFDLLRPEASRDPYGVAEAKKMLDTSYAWLEQYLADHPTAWIAGDDFTLADCAAAPFLFYAHWSYPIANAYPGVLAYRRQLLARPSFARAVDEARPYRRYFPGGAPDAD